MKVLSRITNIITDRKFFIPFIAVLVIVIAVWVLYMFEPEKPYIPVPDGTVVWREDFSNPSVSGEHFIPEDWRVRGKPGTPVTVFSVEKDDTGKGILHMRPDRSSGSLITVARNVDLNEAPIMRWRWKAVKLPEEADGRVPARDDQAIGIYAGGGSMLNNRSVSYRWDTETPVDSEGEASYGMGTVRVKWFTLRNKEDIKKNEWYVEERNVLEDLTDAWGAVPNEVYISITSNSQYTGTEAHAKLDWIEFVAPEKREETL